jgi:hypothetical protein
MPSFETSRVVAASSPTGVALHGAFAGRFVDEGVEVG